MGSFQQSLSSIVKPRNFVEFTWSIVTPLNWTRPTPGKHFKELLNNINFVLFKFNESRLAKIHSVTKVSSELITSWSTLAFLWEKNKLESSANKMNESTDDDRQKSLIKITKSNDPKMDPWGTPCVTWFCATPWPDMETLSAIGEVAHVPLQCLSSYTIMR